MDTPMATLAAERNMNDVHQEDQNIHPFFVRRTKSRESLPNSEHTPILALISANPTVQQITNDRTHHSPELLDVDLNRDRRKRLKSASPHTDPGDRRSLDPAPQKWSKTRKRGRENLPRSETDERRAGSTSNSVKEMQNADGIAHLITSKPPTTVQAPRVHTEAENLQKGLTGGFLVEEKVTDTLSGEMAVSLNNAVNAEPNINNAGSATPIPRKTLRLNPKTGTIGSPPSQKVLNKKNGTGQRPSSGKSPKQLKSLLVCVRYGTNSETRDSVGQSISQILGGIVTYASLRKISPPLPEPVIDVEPPKSTHPFFLGKIAPRTVTSKVIETPPELDALQTKTGTGRTSMTLGEIKSLAPLKKKAQAACDASFHSFGSAHKLPKIPGAVDACWPPQGMVHVRGHDSDRKPPVFQAAQISLSTEKKSKYTATETLAKDDVLKARATKLRITKILADIQKIDADGFAQPEKCLRVPEKHFESGLHLQRRIRHQLSIRLPLIANLEGSTSSEDELQGNQRDQKSVNAALLKVYNGISTSLTAFDRCQYETQSWIQKYAPCCAAEVLQSGKEASILKEWLLALTVVSVETGTRDSSRSRGDSVTSRKPTTTGAEKAGKKKRKSNKLEDFVISSDEEDSCMDEISDLEDNGFSQSSHAFPKRTVIRSGDVFGRRSRESRKLKNAVVISGPTGCGKTAMVYAVAKELGFEVFEINSSSRRSGKEILEKVGDMTRNHLVHPSENCDLLPPQDDDIQRVSDALAADLKSGRQGTMNSFFKPGKTHPNANNKSSKTARKNADAGMAVSKAPKAPPKAQKQSLILLEEVDILYEEDKQFWTTVMNLIALSKRPIVMTCNDEKVLPLQALTLHAIIRLSPPPVDIAVDYMLLIAAAEGHVLKRKAVKALYEARNYDLRASLTELNYWCQLGVGDRKGGLDWCYPRWPPGCDLDGNGNTIRVVSEGTYKTGMGWLGRDFIFGRLHDSETKEQLLQEAWDGWHIDAGELHNSFDTTPSFDTSRLPVLSCYEDFTEAMSVADLCAWGSFSTDNQVSLETSSPPVSAKNREDSIVGYELLQADVLACHDPLHKSISLWMKTQARNLLQSSYPSEVNGISETGISNHIANISQKQDASIDRTYFSLAFDPIAVPNRISQQIGSGLDCSVFDRTTSLIAVDVAPFVRSIVAYDVKLQQRRAKLSNLLSEGGRTGKRIRTTRSALSALEGGARKTTRPEKYFQAELNPYSVQRTGLKYWQDAVASEMEIGSMKEKVVHSVDWDENSISGVSSSQ